MFPAGFHDFSGGALSDFDRLRNAAAFRIEVQFWMRLRDEKKFATPEELREQIARDVARAQKFFNRLRRFRAPRLPAGEEVRK